jgi:hypothetical protein
MFQGLRGAPETLRHTHPADGYPAAGSGGAPLALHLCKGSGHRSVVADPEQGRAVLDEAPGVGGGPLGPRICLRTSDSPQ